MINTLKHLAYELKVQPKEIQTIVNNIDSFYKEWEEIKKDKNGKPKIRNGKVKKRVFNPSQRRLKVIQKRIKKNILQKLEIPDYAFGGVKKKDNIKNARKHQGKKFIFTTDLSDYFPSISHHQVFEMFRAFNFSPTIASYLTKLTTYKGRVPQGAPTSSSIANLIFIKTGKIIQNFADFNNLTFTTFVDDITCSSQKDFKDKIPKIIDIIENNGFKISHQKTSYKTRFPKITGVTVKNNELDLTPEYKEKIKDKNLSKESKKGKELYLRRVKKA